MSPSFHIISVSVFNPSFHIKPTFHIISVSAFTVLAGEAMDKYKLAETCLKNAKDLEKSFPEVRFRAKREHLKRFQGLEPESRGQNLAVPVLYMPYSVVSGSPLFYHAPEAESVTFSDNP